MSRTSTYHLATHTWLRSLWLENDASVFAELSPRDQRYLHGFFAPSEPWSDEELLRYRQLVTGRQPSLPQCAGRAVVKLRRVLAGERVYRPPALVSAGGKGRRPHRITVRRVVRPKPDTDRLARALIDLAVYLNETDRTKVEGKKDDAA
jgi:hypothetical protein